MLIRAAKMPAPDVCANMIVRAIPGCIFHYYVEDGDGTTVLAGLRKNLRPTSKICAGFKWGFDGICILCGDSGRSAACRNASAWNLRGHKMRRRTSPFK